MSLTVYEPNKIQWRERPAGPEQLLLESMFEDGTIDVYCTPESVRNMRMEFREFSPRVFASHFRKTKAKFGGFASNKRSQQDDVNLAVGKKPNVTSIPELGSPIGSKLSTSKHTISKPSTSKAATSKSFIEDAGVEICNPPSIVWTYTDHEKKIDFVCVVISVFSGKTSMTFEVDEEGMKVVVRFSWPKIIYDAKSLFKSAKEK